MASDWRESDLDRAVGLVESDPDAEEFGEAVEELTKALAHHLDEEERTILNPAREDVDESTRERLGAAFLEERQRRLDKDCGSIENVRRLVEKAAHE
jgi:hypothetical protein